MLHSGPDHPKTLALQARLEVGRAQVVGHLELLWIFTSCYAPEGDVGRWPDPAIAQACAWEGSPGDFIAALVGCGFLDHSESHRLVVHDWHEHAARYIKRRLARKNRAFASYVGAQRATKKARRAPKVPRGAAPPNRTQPNPTEPSLGGNGAAPGGAAPWSREACDDWIARFAGSAPGAKIGTALKPLLQKYPWEVLRPAWKAYLADCEPRWASPRRFADLVGAWLPSRASGATPEPADPIPEADEGGPACWAAVTGRLMPVIPPHSWATWFRPLRAVQLRNLPGDANRRVLVLVAPGVEWRRQLRDVYHDRLHEAAADAGYGHVRFQVLIEGPS